MNRAASKKSPKKRGARKGAARKPAAKKPPEFTPVEQRAARARRIRVEPAEPYGWFAFSSQPTQQPYHLFVNPETRTLTCTCADFIFRAEDIDHACKHVIAVMLHVAAEYLKNEYMPERQQAAQQPTRRPHRLPRAA